MNILYDKIKKEYYLMDVITLPNGITIESDTSSFTPPPIFTYPKKHMIS